jgi:hypothetical protein
MAYEETLIKQLEDVAGRTDLPLERRLVDTAVWFHKNKGRIPAENLGKRVDFMEKTLDIMLELVALSIERIHKTEGRHSALYLPSGMSMRGDLKKFG